MSPIGDIGSGGSQLQHRTNHRQDKIQEITERETKKNKKEQVTHLQGKAWHHLHI